MKRIMLTVAYDGTNYHDRTRLGINWPTLYCNVRRDAIDLNGNSVGLLANFSRKSDFFAGKHLIFKKGLTSIGKCCIITRVAKNNEYLFAEVHHG